MELIVISCKFGYSLFILIHNFELLIQLKVLLRPLPDYINMQFSSWERPSLYIQQKDSQSTYFASGNPQVRDDNVLTWSEIGPRVEFDPLRNVKGTSGKARAGNVEASAFNDRERESEKTLIEDDEPELNEMYQGAYLDLEILKSTRLCSSNSLQSSHITSWEFYRGTANELPNGK
jgi:hypothetical protein